MRLCPLWNAPSDIELHIRVMGEWDNQLHSPRFFQNLFSPFIVLSLCIQLPH